MNADKTYKNGQKVSELEGDVLTYYFKTGMVKAKGPFVNGKMQGKWIFYRESGELWQVGNFMDDKKDGEFLRYDRDGKLEYHVIFENGKLVKKLI
jgi:antitoxin component YwqK of YwqJK toxin-antitoxin module